MPLLGLWRRRALSLSMSVFLGVFASAEAQPRASFQLPTGFTQEVVASGLNEPTTFSALPDGRLLIAELAGVVRLY